MSSNDQSSDAAAAALRSINEKTLMGASGGSTFQVVTLPNGDKIPTGTVAGMLVNIKSYDEAYRTGDKATMAELEPQIAATVPVLRKLGMFDLFKPEEWVNGESAGRKLVGELATKV